MELIITGLIQGAIIALYIGLCKLVSKLGEKRKIGSHNSFILSFILTPIVGVIVTLLTPENSDIEEK